MNWYCLLLPLTGFIAGWLLNTFFISFLFNRLFKKKEQLAAILAKSINENFQLIAIMKTKIAGTNLFDTVKPSVETHIDIFLTKKLPQQMPVISMFIGDKTTNQLKATFMNELEIIFPEIIGQILNNVEADINIGNLVAEKIMTLNKKNLQQKLRKPVLQFQLWGGIAGFIVSVLQLLLIYSLH